MSYRFDELGWHQFERLTQALLKADVGLGVEAWGGHSDLGRDAYCESPLNYPDRAVESPGPFLFQAKFVMNAAAAGAEPMPALQKAVRGEKQRIAKRVQRGLWPQPPAQYILMTNVPMTTERRKWVVDCLSTVLPDAAVSVQGAGDIAALLDGQPMLRLSFPELLGLRDLQALLAGPIEKVITERSSAALEEAKELAPVFVKTKAYERALQQLVEHGVVVLDGPPEVGKTAIARTIGLAMVTTGWEFVDCRWPEDVLQKYKSCQKQVFVVDDALGRTEYLADYGLHWETELPTVLRKVDATHWLIWTSRKHILVRGLERMDLKERAREALAAAATPVDASALSELERARMLYRHAKAKQLCTPVKRLIRRRARRVIDNKKFTPERLRRLIDDVAVNGNDYMFEPKRFDAAIRRTLSTASKSMRQVFKAFPETPRWVLVVAAELGEQPSEQRLYRHLRTHRPLLSEQEFTRHLDMLDGTFIKRITVDGRNGEYAGIDWIHPSYRDVVIEHVNRDWELQAQFWKNASPRALGLAFSEAGGAKGDLVWAWASCPAVFEDIERVMMGVVSDHQLSDVEKLMSILAGAMRAAAPEASRQRFAELVPRVLEAIETRWRNAQHVPSLRELTLRSRICRAHGLAMPVGYVKAGWLDHRQSLKGRDDSYDLDAYSVEGWIDWVQLLDSVVPELWAVAGISALLLDDIEAIHKMLETEAELEVDDIEPEYLKEEKDRIEQLFSLADSFYTWTERQSVLEVDDTPYHELNEMHDELERLLEPEEGYVSSKQLQGSLELGTSESKDTVEALMRDL